MSTYVPQTEAAAKNPARQPNLRLSCDACGLAKVKCSKDRPQCERCASMQVKCVYGISLRHGRPQRKRSHPQPSAPIQRDRRTSVPTPHQQQQRQHRQQQDTYNSMLKDSYLDLERSLNSPVDFLGEGKPVSAGWSQDLAESKNMPDTVINTQTPTMSYQMPLSQPQDNMDGFAAVAEPMFASMSPFDQGYVPPEGWESPATSSMSSDLSNTFDMDMTSSIDGSMSSSPPAMESSPEEPMYLRTSTNANGNHDCYASGWEIMSSLESCSNKMSHATSPLMAYGTTTTNLTEYGSPARTLDEILQVNRNAITKTCELLQCSCVNRPDMAMLLGSIIVKILQWHRVSSSKSGESPYFTPQEPFLPTPDSNNSPLSSHPTTGTNTPYRNRSWTDPPPNTINPAVISKMSTEPVRIGQFVPDDEAQEPIRRLLILSNLKKAKPMIEYLSYVSESCEDPQSRNLYTMLGSWLRDELDRTVKEVCEKTSTGMMTPVSACC